jgi:hypothetical protein
MPARGQKSSSGSSKSSRKAAPSRKAPARDPVKRFYAGLPIPCPIECGGTAQVILVNTTDDGRGEVWFECMSCVQRGRYDMPKATPKEKKQVAAMVEEGEPTCPRHAERTPLRSRGRQLACPACGVVYRGPK